MNSWTKKRRAQARHAAKRYVQQNRRAAKGPARRGSMKTSRKELKSTYRSTATPTGVFQIRNRVNGKIFVGTAQNIPGIINSNRFQLIAGAHPNAGLQAEWRQFGPEAFVFETLDELTVNDDSSINIRTELSPLEELWLEKLQPYGERGYHDQ